MHNPKNERARAHASRSLFRTALWRRDALFYEGLANSSHHLNIVLDIDSDQHIILTFFSGCDSGIGQGMAKYFDKQGFYVYAGLLDAQQEGINAWQANCSERLKVLQLDITKDEEVEEAVRMVKEDLNGGGK